ncbi:hypothetical protein WJX73_004068 [Symbiochloris irregularis]|uniref:Glycosyl transferase CAP10 domain-containing protein n=1 Tax=Symbiochloris irregularis TaxID=706552 RepID=A0AAW1PT25_9CHLO
MARLDPRHEPRLALRTGLLHTGLSSIESVQTFPCTGTKAHALRVVQWIRQWPVLCLVTASALGILLLADFVTQIASTTTSVGYRDTGFGPWLWGRASPKAGQQDGRLSSALYLETHCSSLAKEHEQLAEEYLKHWPLNSITVETMKPWYGFAYIHGSDVFMGPELERGRLMPTYLHMLHGILQHVALPDMPLPLNAADEPLAKDDEHDVPLMSFCRPNRGMIDILIPNALEGDVFRPGEAYRGVRKGRWALLEAGRQHPHLVDSGASDWDPDMYGEELGRKKNKLTFAQQVERYKYLIWVTGNCASVRLAKQLAADALVFKVDSDEREWYYPLLQPHVHYVPVWLNVTDPEANLTTITAQSSGIADAVRWAESHPEQVRSIVEAANAFARRHLSVRGRDCYFVRLLHLWHTRLKRPIQQGPREAELYIPP